MAAPTPDDLSPLNLSSRLPASTYENHMHTTLPPVARCGAAHAPRCWRRTQASMNEQKSSSAVEGLMGDMLRGRSDPTHLPNRTGGRTVGALVPPQGEPRASPCRRPAAARERVVEGGRGPLNFLKAPGSLEPPARLSPLAPAHPEEDRFASLADPRR